MYRFAHIEYLQLLWIIPVLILAFVAYRNWQKRARLRWGDAPLLAEMTEGKSTAKPWLKLMYSCFAIAFLAIALANPQVGTRMETVKRQGVDLVFALDVSASMLAEDVAPSRLEKAKYLIAKSLEELGGDRVGIIAYAGKAYPLCPITTDYSAAKLALSSASPDFIPTPGTALEEALDYSLTYFDPESPASKVLVVISDGEDHDENWKEFVPQLNERGIKVLAIGLGTAKGGPIPLKTGSSVVGYKKDENGEVVITRQNDKVLRELALQTNGSYVSGSNTNGTLEALKSTLTGLDKVDIEERVFTDYDDQFQWFLAVAFALLLIELITADRRGKWMERLGLKSKQS
jgi:Ca-activated chloride channel family protein